MNDNRQSRVFVSSTFRDMVGEREELMAQTWPELRRSCRERQVELVEWICAGASPRSRARARKPQTARASPNCKPKSVVRKLKP